MKSKLFSVLALVGVLAPVGCEDGDFMCTARHDEVAVAIQKTQEQLTELRTVDERSWLARVPWFGRDARLEHLASTLEDQQGEGFMLAIACGGTLARRSDLGMITVPRLHGAMLQILERTGAMDVNARRAIGGAASALRRADHQLTDGLTTLANEYDDRTLAYQNPDASPPVPGGETESWPSARDVVALLGVVALLLMGWKLVGRPMLWLARRLLGNAQVPLLDRQTGQQRSSGVARGSARRRPNP